MDLRGSCPGREIQDHFQDFILDSLKFNFMGVSATGPYGQGVLNHRIYDLFIDSKLVLQAQFRCSANQWIQVSDEHAALGAGFVNV